MGSLTISKTWRSGNLKEYESIFILDNEGPEKGVDGFLKALKPFVEGLGGKIGDVNDMGQRQFAHPIKKKHTGHYLDIILTLPEEKVIDVKDKFRLDSSVLRVELFIYEPPPVKKEDETISKENSEENAVEI